WPATPSKSSAAPAAACSAPPPAPPDLGWGSEGLGGLSLSADGKQLFVAGTFSWNGGVFGYDFAIAGQHYTEGDAGVVVLPSGELSDPQLDSAGDYKDATLVFERQNAPGAVDVFGFVAANGLSLRDGQLFKDNVAIATFVQANGRLSITFLAGVSQATRSRCCARSTTAIPARTRWPAASRPTSGSPSMTARPTAPALR
ncbi:hypothetical protein G3435_25290, partial [Pseudomonas sp. MAFF212428]|nr:hypothetical protein [Pseudomonas brassicae]